MSRRYLLLSFCLFPLPVFAQNQLCNQIPDCAALGFSTDYEEGCADDGYLTCPFDSNYRKCVKQNPCANSNKELCGKEIGWNRIYDDETSCYSCSCSANDCIWTTDNKGSDMLVNKCCNGKYKKCISLCPLGTSVPENAEATEWCTGCDKQVALAWQCKDGYKLSGSSCVAKTCADYGYETSVLFSPCKKQYNVRLGSTMEYCYDDCMPCNPTSVAEYCKNHDTYQIQTRRFSGYPYGFCTGPGPCQNSLLHCQICRKK